ncbi:MAG: hypothetical protein J0I06_13030 [Planctomycetes bacterium]|nr:hypothetical protein [Planctomycetota bacterium]
MSTEQQQPPASGAPTAPNTVQGPHAAHATEPKADPNALARALTDGWDKFKQGKLVSYPMMAILLLVVTAVGLTWWIVHSRRAEQSARWTELDGLSTPAALEEYAKKYPDTVQAKLANLEIARTLLGPEGIERLTATDANARKTAVANVEKARESFTKLVDDFKDDPVIRVECMLACAKAEAVLVGMPKEGQVIDPLNPKAIESRGDPKKAVEWLDKVAEAAPDTDWGKDAKKLADTLRNQNTEQQVLTLQGSVYNLSPSLPGFPFDPKMPKDAAHGFPIPPVGP